jgi:hypothetical protein
MTTEKTRELCRKINDLLDELGREIEETKTMGEADALNYIMRLYLDNHKASEVWDHRVDWDKVTWK